MHQQTQKKHDKTNQRRKSGKIIRRVSAVQKPNSTCSLNNQRRVRATLVVLSRSCCNTETCHRLLRECVDQRRDSLSFSFASSSFLLFFSFTLFFRSFSLFFSPSSISLYLSIMCGTASTSLLHKKREKQERSHPNCTLRAPPVLEVRKEGVLSAHRS